MNSTMTLTRKAKVRVKAEERVKEEEVRLEIRIRIRIRTTIISRELPPEPRTEPVAILVPQEEQGTAMSGARGYSQEAKITVSRQA